MRRLLTALLLCAGLCQPAQSQEHIRIAIGEWPPFISASLPHYGVVPQLISEVFASQNVSVEYGFFPWKRAYTEVKQGHWQASAIWGRTPEREADCLFSAVVYSDELVLFYRRDKPISWDGRLAGAEQLNGLRIGIPLGSAKMPVLEQAEQRAQRAGVAVWRASCSTSARLISSVPVCAGCPRRYTPTSTLPRRSAADTACRASPSRPRRSSGRRRESSR